MNKINTTQPHYIRCVKPNHERKPASVAFDAPVILQQLTYAGVFEAVNIRRKGYPFRLTHEKFFKRYASNNSTQLDCLDIVASHTTLLGLPGRRLLQTSWRKFLETGRRSRLASPWFYTRFIYPLSAMTNTRQRNNDHLICWGTKQ